MYHWRSLWQKEWTQLQSPLFIVLLVLIWWIWGIYFLSAVQEYQTLSPQLALLSTPRGASDMLLVPLNHLLGWLLAIYTVFVVAKSLGDEFLYRTVALFYRDFYRWLTVKLAAIATLTALATLPFWCAVIWLSMTTDFDDGVVAGIVCGQIVLLLYALGLGAVFTMWLRHTLAAAAFLVLWLILLWLLPSLISEPAFLVLLLQWLSPFAHVGLLHSGQFSLQTAVFVLLHGGYFISLLIFLHGKLREC